MNSEPPLTPHNFPPFYTSFPDCFHRLQPVLSTRQKQIQLWKDLVLNYCRTNKIFELDLNEASNSPLFSNDAIKRRLPLDVIQLIFQELVKSGNAEWNGQGLSRAFVYWRSLAEWANQILSYVNRSGMSDSVCTMYELRESDEVSGEEFYMLDEKVFLKALRILEQQGKAKIFTGSNGDIGVKFL